MSAKKGKKAAPGVVGRLEDHQSNVSGQIVSLAPGYRGMYGLGFMAQVAYIELPATHPDVGKNYGEIPAPVNGGLTYGNGRVFGWDYAHYLNYGTPKGDMKAALRFFRKREKGADE